MASADFLKRLDALRAEFLALNQAGTVFYYEFTEDQLLDLASGYVPVALKAMFVASLDWAEEDRRRAQRPVRAKK